MNKTRKVLDLLAPKEVKEMLKFLDGKKTILGIIIAQLPGLIDAVTQIVSATGGDTSAWTKVSGGVLMLIGLLHKFLKDAPPAAPKPVQ